MPAFHAEVLRAFDDFVGPSDVDIAPHGSLYDFVRQMWPIVEPDQAFVDNWHIHTICEHLEAVTKGTITHLLINLPPGCMKSLIVSVFWPAWEWARDPGLRFLCASYGEDLSIRDNLRTRDIISSREYRDRWSHVRTRADQNQKRRFDTTNGGWRLATSVGGRGTGEHPDRIIIDDPHNVKQTLSDVERQRAIDWFDGTISTRGVSRNARIVVIMQRLHEKDLSGHILSRADASRWVHLCLPMQYEPGRMKTTPLGFRDPRTVPGQLLWPAMFAPARVNMLQAALGSYRSAGQLQQRPAPAEGGLLKRQWFQYFAPHRPPAVFEILISCDPALKDKQQNDLAAIQAWGISGADRYLLRRAVGRWDLVELTQQLRDMYRWAHTQHPRAALTLLVENTAAGPDAIAILKRELTGVIAFTPKGDKVQRANAAAPALEAGNVFVPGAADPSGRGCDSALTPGWVQEFITTCAGFPNADQDADVDAFSQMILRLQAAGVSSVAAIKAGDRTVATPTNGHGMTARALRAKDELATAVRQFGSAAVELIRRQTDPAFTLPCDLQNIPAGNGNGAH